MQCYSFRDKSRMSHWIIHSSDLLKHTGSTCNTLLTDAHSAWKCFCWWSKTRTITDYILSHWYKLRNINFWFTEMMYKNTMYKEPAVCYGFYQQGLSRQLWPLVDCIINSSLSCHCFHEQNPIISLSVSSILSIYLTGLERSSSLV